MAADLSGYRVRFYRVARLNLWTWSAVAPDGRRLSPMVIGGWAQKAAAEVSALRAIEADAQREEITGSALADRITERRDDG